MNKLPVKSRIIRSVYFSPEDGRLRICFTNGEERLFEGVPETEVLGLVKAPSPGTYYIENIRHRFHRLAS